MAKTADFFVATDSHRARQLREPLGDHLDRARCGARGSDPCHGIEASVRWPTSRPGGRRVNDPKTYRTKSGRVLEDGDLDAMSADVESADYDVEQLKTRKRGRPAMGSAAADVVPVRLDPELRDAVESRAKSDETTTSDVIRRALKEFLHVAS